MLSIVDIEHLYPVFNDKKNGMTVRLPKQIKYWHYKALADTIRMYNTINQLFMKKTIVQEI